MQEDTKLFVQGYAVMEKTGEVAAVVSNRSSGQDGQSRLVREPELLANITHIEEKNYSSRANSLDVGNEVKWMAKQGIPIDAGRDNLITLRSALESIHSIESDPSRKSSLQRLNDVNEFVTIDGRKLGDLPEGNQPQDKMRIEGGLVQNTIPVMPKP